jgi:hypothetical protein
VSESGLERSQGGGRFPFVRFAIHFRSRGGRFEAFAIAKKEGVLGSYNFYLNLP